MKKLENREQLDDLINGSTKLVVDFYSPTCAPCKVLEPILIKMQDVHPECTFVKIDITEHEQIAKDLGVRGVPTLMMFEDGILSSVKVGLLSEDKLKLFIEG